VPGIVRVLGFAPVDSPKLPLSVVGARPEIRLFAAAVQLGVNGKLPHNWLVPVTVSRAKEELTNISKAKQTKLATVCNFEL
jgi:hypothetical protein